MGSHFSAVTEMDWKAWSLVSFAFAMYNAWQWKTSHVRQRPARFGILSTRDATTTRGAREFCRLAVERSSGVSGGASGLNFRCSPEAPPAAPVSELSSAAFGGPAAASTGPASRADAARTAACQLSEMEENCVRSDLSQSVSISWATSFFSNVRNVPVGWKSASAKMFSGTNSAGMPTAAPSTGSGRTVERSVRNESTVRGPVSKPEKMGFSRPRIFWHSLLSVMKRCNSLSRGTLALISGTPAVPCELRISKSPQAATPRT
mmetsp:Transcript_9330/g.27586  ORF Transcript_9330/g.27586 Transcript_9330/m.27586 type:complete len:262 (+) Transcript_9330:511-1296(+)